FISIHQEGLFPPLSGTLHETGSGEGLGTTINVPLPAGSGHDAYLTVMNEVVTTAASAFAPDLILVAAGLDLSAHDQMGRQLCTSRTLRLMTTHICRLADDLCEGRIVFGHEGGYSTWYLPILVRAVAAAIVGLGEQADPFLHGLAHLPGQRLAEHQRRRIEQVRAAHQAHLLAGGDIGSSR
ncbi:MAG: class II histone deacetylase, partial [Actinomycetota bacterium]